MRLSSTRSTLFALVGVLGAGALSAQAGSQVSNWTVPPYRTAGAGGGYTTMADISDASIFVAVTPCRVVDTRGPAGPYGAPALTGNLLRTFDIDSGPCAAIPAGSAAYSLSIGAILPPADGFLKAWPTGSAEPLVSQLNFLAGEVVANAAIVPSNASGQINVLVNVGPTDIYIDINGYFMDSGGQLNDNTTLRVAGSDANEPTIYGLNFDVTSASEFMNGVRGYINTVENNAAGAQSGPSGVYGWSDGVTGVNFGVFGRTDSTTNGAAGVRGQAASIPTGTSVLPNLNAGVLGISDDNVGVLGVTQGSASDGAVRGRYYDAAGTTLQSEGILGFDSNTGVRFINGLDGTGTKAFIEPHPTDASKMIKYVSLEGNEVGTYFRGKGRFERGVAIVNIPEDFRMVTHEDGLSIQVTPIGEMATVAVAHIGLDRIVVRGSRNVEFFYTVNGVRKAYPSWNPIWENNGFIPESADEKIPGNLSADEKRRLISNGTYHPDGSVNRETARRLGWERKWMKLLTDEDPRPTPDPGANP